MAQATETKTTAAVVANPAPLGLFAFASTTLVLSAWNSGFSGVDPAGALGMALFYGGLGQLLAGMWEFKSGNTFGAAAFSSYGAFWLSFWASIHLESGFLKGTNVGWYLLTWTIVTGLFFLGTLRQNFGLVGVFGLLFLTFLLLCLGAFNGQAAGTGLTSVGGYLGIATAVVAYYVGLAGIMHHVSNGKISLPTFPIGN
jgi:succinate-acetate transporter protein